MAKQIDIQTEYDNSLSYGAGYIGGSAAPQLEPRREKRDSRSKQLNPKQVGIGKATFVFMLVCACMFIATVAFWISANSEKTNIKEKIENCQTELQNLRADNDATEVYLNKSIDLDYIYKVATEELGMVYPSDDQVIYYERSDEGYVRQYEDIPTN